MNRKSSSTWIHLWTLHTCSAICWRGVLNRSNTAQDDPAPMGIIVEPLPVKPQQTIITRMNWDYFEGWLDVRLGKEGVWPSGENGGHCVIQRGIVDTFIILRNTCIYWQWAPVWVWQVVYEPVFSRLLLWLQADRGTAEVLQGRGTEWACHSTSFYILAYLCHHDFLQISIHRWVSHNSSCVKLLRLKSQPEPRPEPFFEVLQFFLVIAATGEVGL